MDIITHRRALHQIPELDRALPRTMAYLTHALEGLGCDIFSPAESSLCAWFDFGRDSAIAFRSDADALPVTEHTGAAYASRIPGQMHACGHDGHMAILLELARRLKAAKNLPHNVLLIFQCAEETTGGAREICESGILTAYNVQAVFGLHLWPGLAQGLVFTRENELMCRSCEVTVDIFGKSAHIAKASEGVDALAAGVEFYRRAAALEAGLPENAIRLLKFGRLESGTVRNAISAHTRLEGSLRAFQPVHFEALRNGLAAIAADLEQETGCTVTLHTTDGCPAVINPPALIKKIRRISTVEELPAPSMTAEDFSWYQQYVPGAFFFLGLGDVPPLHSDTFDFDDSILTKGADFFQNLAENFL